MLNGYTARWSVSWHGLKYVEALVNRLQLQADAWHSYVYYAELGIIDIPLLLIYYNAVPTFERFKRYLDIMIWKLR